MRVPLQLISGISDIVLLWRAIVRQTYEVLQRLINPTTIAGLVLPEENANQIDQTERNEGRLQAVDQLINKLMNLSDISWTKLLPLALRKYHPEVFEIVAMAKEDILKEQWAAQTIGNKRV